MRIFTSLLAGVGRKPQNELAVPFQEMLPLKLKNSVSGKSDSQKEVNFVQREFIKNLIPGEPSLQVACLQEMAVLFACLKTHDFLESNCLKEITTFKGCYKTNIDKDLSIKQSKHKNIAVPGKDVTYKQLNKYMRMYPNP